MDLYPVIISFCDEVERFEFAWLQNIDNSADIFVSLTCSKAASEGTHCNCRSTVQSHYNTPHYNMDLDITCPCCSS